MNRTTRIEVYTDGQCPFCRWTRARIEPHDLERRIEWLDYNDPEILRRAVPYTLEELGEAMHVRRADGGWTEGFWGALEILRVLPRWRWLARVLALWPFTRFGPVCYHWIARRRYTLFGIPPPCDATGLCTLHRPKS